MVQVTMKTPYASAMPYVSALPDGVDEYNAQRIASYDLYDDLYTTDPATLRSMMEVSDETAARFLPLAQTIVDTMARFVGKSWRYNILAEFGTPAEQEAAKEAFAMLFRRERMVSKYVSMKPELIRRGDAVWYVRADPDKAEGSRISISTVDPRSYFPITDADDPDRTIGAMLIEEFIDEDGETPVTKVQRWLKPSHPEHPQYETGEFISYEMSILEIGTAFDEEPKVIRTPVPIDILEGIRQIPLYHIRNREQSQNPFGRSDLTGLESLCAGVSQSLTDEDTAIAMAGLGMFATDSGAPKDDEGNETDWILGPNRVVEIDRGAKFERVNGVASTEASQSHIRLIEDRADGSLGISGIATGIKVDGMAGAFSGVALAIRMQPIMDAADQKDSAINGIMSQMFYDLKDWFSAYEGINLGEVQIESWSSATDRVPFDRQQAWSELMDGYNSGVFSLKYVQAQLANRFGYGFDYQDEATVVERDDLEEARSEWFARNGMDSVGANVSMDNRMAAERALS